MTKLSFLPSLQKTRHPAAGGNNTYRLTVRRNYQNLRQIQAMLKYHNVKSGTVAELLPDSVNITNVDDILQLMVDAGYSKSAYGMIIHAKSLPAEFFELKSGVAGEILQKFSNYRMKLAIVGHFSEIKSKSLRDFIRESNNRKIISFVSTLNEALSILDK